MMTGGDYKGSDESAMKAVGLNMLLDIVNKMNK